LEGLVINGRVIDPDNLISKDWDWTGFSASEVKSLELIRAWLMGQQEFAFKTSGSTGTPKVCSFSREQIEKSALRTLDFFKLRPEDTVLCCLNTEFIAGFMMIIRGLIGRV